MEENKICKCDKVVEQFPHYNMRLEYQDTSSFIGWVAEGVNGWGETLRCPLPDIKYCPWCGGLLKQIECK